MVTALPRVSCVVVAYGAEPWLEQCVDAILNSRDVETEVVLVDNGCTDGAVDRLLGRKQINIVRPGHNTGFSAGCHLGVAAAQGDMLAFINPDAIVEPNAIAALNRCANRPTVGIATASIRFADKPDRINSAGNEIHFLGVSWAGGFDNPADCHTVERHVIAASGGGMAMRRCIWAELGGFAPEFFIYYEDADLSLRCWQHGMKVVYVPEALVVHRYEFLRHPSKYYFAERNRLAMLLSCYGLRTLFVLAPLLVAFELGVSVFAISRGWLWDKVRGWWWLLTHAQWLLNRRNRIQRARTVADRELATLFAEGLDPLNLRLPNVVHWLDRMLCWYWRLVR